MKMRIGERRDTASAYYLCVCMCAQPQVGAHQYREAPTPTRVGVALFMYVRPCFACVYYCIAEAGAQRPAYVRAQVKQRPYPRSVPVGKGRVRARE